MMGLSRREALAGMFGSIGTAAITGMAVQAQDTSVPPISFAHGIRVQEFGAKGDGATDDTDSFRKALEAVGSSGGGQVLVPPGNYRITGNLQIPKSTTLVGALAFAPACLTTGGSVIQADFEPASETGEPFLSLDHQSTIAGLTIHYTQQNDPSNIKPYPWCVRAVGDNAAIINCLLTNPYQAADFGTITGGRHFIDGLYAQALRRGLYIDSCFDVGRARNVHFWPFWTQDPNARAYTDREGEAFIIGKTDWQMMDFCFCIWYHIGFRFIKGNHGAGNVMITNSGSDVGPIAVQVDQVMEHAGVTFSNCQFMHHIRVNETNKGPVKFTSSGFWGIHEPKRNVFCETHATVAGKGNVSFDNCHFTTWDMKKEGHYCLDANSESICVRNCDFLDNFKNQIRIGESVKTAIVMGNRLRGGKKVDVQSKGSMIIEHNSEV